MSVRGDKREKNEKPDATRQTLKHVWYPHTASLTCWWVGGGCALCLLCQSADETQSRAEPNSADRRRHVVKLCVANWHFSLPYKSNIGFVTWTWHWTSFLARDMRSLLTWCPSVCRVVNIAVLLLLPILSAILFTRTWLRYVRVFAVAIPSVCRLSVCNVGAPYSGGWSFRQNFFTAVYAGHHLTSVQNFTEIDPGEPLCRGR